MNISMQSWNPEKGSKRCTSKPDRRSTHISDIPFINSLENQILNVESEIILRWLAYFDGLPNTDNPRKQNENGLLTEGPIEIFNQ